MAPHVGALLVAVTAVSAVALTALADHQAPGLQGLYFHFQNTSSTGGFEAGHTRGNPGHWIARHEHQHGPSNRGHVRWYDHGSTGLQVWDLQHAETESEEDWDQLYQLPHRKSVSDARDPEPPQEQQHHQQDADCLLKRLQRRAHSTLITRDCQGNPLEPPGVRLSPGLPRPPLNPRVPTRPPPPAGSPPTSWRHGADQTQQTPANVYLQMKKRGGRDATGTQEGVVGVFDRARGFEPTAEEDQDGQEDHLRGMKHADKQLMFGDGSYQASNAQIYRVQPVKMKLPWMKQRPTMKWPMRVLPMKVPISLQVSPVRGGVLPGPRPVLPMPMRGRIKPVVVMVRPMSSNRLPVGGKGPVGAARPLPLREWLTNMLNGG